MCSKRCLIISGRFLYYTLFPFAVMLIGQLILFPWTQGNVLTELQDHRFLGMLYAPLLGVGLLIAGFDLSYTIKNGRPGPLIEPAVSRFISKIAKRRDK